MVKEKKGVYLCGFRSQSKAPYNPSAKHIGFMRAYKSPTHLMWATIGFTEKLSVDFHHKGHIVFNCKTPLQQQFDGECCNLNWFDAKCRIYGAEQLPVSAAASSSVEVFE